MGSGPDGHGGHDRHGGQRRHQQFVGHRPPALRVVVRVRGEPLCGLQVVQGCGGALPGEGERITAEGQSLTQRRAAEAQRLSTEGTTV
jgi:hypothetical protein